ncbi:probable E3 ubiquitin-protein ligase TRIML1 [Gracilinanus agilis]|uniref:probable E3 ubiquitin-protein ligase TRIML1 n=1 Tax=Gracilinanus agilis TaxID=191870 RepID=UPI001CFE4DF0|nr:probable E3 ubiquitin-protein ligase TRIML1 [Gracilinanus agilis]
MEAKELIENSQANLTCSICLGYFTDPVTVKCGHNFCKDCLLQCDEQPDATLTCPECRDVIRSSDIVLNKNLQNLSITGKALRQHLLLSPVLLTTYEQHGEKEKLFCEQDQKLICDSCLLTEEHKDHQVLPLQMAADKCKEKLQETQNILQGKEEEFKMALDEVRKRKAQCKADINLVRQSVRYEYEKMHQLLWDEEDLYLQKLDQEYTDNLAKLEKNEAKLSQQMQNLQLMILEVEANLDQASLQMLQDIKSPLERNEELLLQKPEVVFPNFTTYSITGLKEMFMNFYRDITVDPETTIHLILTEDFKKVNYGNDSQGRLVKEEGLDCVVNVLGTQTFTSGKYYWEVDVGGQTEWSVGICKDSVSKYGKLSILSEDVKALIGLKAGNDFLFWNSEEGFLMIPPLHKVGIFLDYDRGHISFYDVRDTTLLFSPQNKAFQGPVRPYFSPCLFNEGSTP